MEGIPLQRSTRKKKTPCRIGPFLPSQPQNGKPPCTSAEEDADVDEADLLSQLDSLDAGPPTITSNMLCSECCKQNAAAGNGPYLQEAWKTEFDPDTFNPRPPRFMPKRTPGYQLPLATGLPTPVDIFKNFFESDVMKLLCSNTNKRARKRKECGKRFVWTEITPQELKKYLGLLLFMSVCYLPKMTDFWRKNTIFHIAFPASIMSRDRFRTIGGNIHLSDPDEDFANEQKIGTEEYDPLQKVKALLEKIRTSCKRIYHPYQHISVDESTIVTKARVMRAKPTKSRLKCFVLADVNGYAVDFKFYTGKRRRASRKGHSFDVMADLVNSNFLGSGYIVYCDGFFTSPLLFHHLSQQGFGACGTYRQGKFGVPKIKENALDKKSARGSIRWIRDGNLLYVKWKDTSEVSMITTVHPVYSGDTVVRLHEIKGRCHRVHIPRPTAVAEYNKYMGGADTSDQMPHINAFHRTRRWPVMVFQHCLDIALTNSYIIHKEISRKQQQKHMTRQQFQEKLCAQLLGVDDGPPVTSGQGHFPIPCSSGEGVAKAQRASLGRKRCTLCKKSTPWMCKECCVGLCLQLGRNCFTKYHSC